ncbi:hypothetical protein VTL71DRAFT_4968 [Oculimacula yallundae]|uniref:2EXR domain-containing protein n=1 Tax=Oculimacula yallundae TaxID=86028 RepID=A0ABR4C588_9HELO
MTLSRKSSPRRKTSQLHILITILDTYAETRSSHSTALLFHFVATTPNYSTIIPHHIADVQLNSPTALAMNQQTAQVNVNAGTLASSSLVPLPSDPKTTGTYSLDLAAELPDLFQLLFLQLGKDLDQFTCFEKPPLELKNMIWRFTFPRGRHANFNYNVGWTFGLDKPDNSKAKGVESHGRLPVALHVNQDSRLETFRHYCVAFRKEEYIEGWKPRPLCFNPILDTVFLTLQQDDRRLTTWVGEIQQISPSLFGLIVTIEIRCLWLPYAMHGARSSEDLSFVGSFKPLLKFSGLKYLKIIRANSKVPKFMPHCDTETEEAEKRMINKMGDLLRFSGVWEFTPTISIESWSELR